MRKNVKRFTAAVMSVIMMFGMLCVNAFATGVLNQTYGMSSNVPYYQCQYTVDGNLKLSGHGKYAGAMENNSFYVTENGNYKITFSSGGDCGASVNFWKAGTYNPNNSAYKMLNVPQHTPGMPSTLETTFYFTKGYYDVEIISSKYGYEISGSLRVYGVLEEKQG